MIRIFNHSVSLMVLYAVVLHLVWAAMLLVDNQVSAVTAIASLRYVFPFPFAVLVMIWCALSAFSAFYVRNGYWAAGLMVPQQFLLFISAGGAIQAMVEGQFADGTIRSAYFLVADQSPAVLAAIGHTLAIFATARAEWRGR
jgi:hypothetical protein